MNENFPGEALRWILEERHHLLFLKDVHSCWLGGNQDSVVRSREAEQRKGCGNDQGAEVEVQVPAGGWLHCQMQCDPTMYLSHDQDKEKSQSVEQKGGDKVGPRPFPVDHETVPWVQERLSKMFHPHLSELDQK